jgi:hypothetical protein
MGKKRIVTTEGAEQTDAKKAPAVSAKSALRLVFSMFNLPTITPRLC